MAKKMQDPMEKPVTFKEIPKSDTQKTRIWYNVFKGNKLFCIQSFWREDPKDSWRFGKAITFHPEVIPDIIEGLQAMDAWCQDNFREESYSG